MTHNTNGKTRYERVRTGALRVDPVYQRDLNEKRIQKMATEWSDDLAGYVVANERDTGGTWVIDGQHRLAAARAARVEWLWAIVHVALTPAEEADLFWRLNSSRVALKSVHVFRARLAAGDDEAESIVAACDAAGVKLDLHGGPLGGPDHTKAVATLQAIHGTLGPVGLTRTLRAIRTAWPESQALQAVAIAGVASFIYVYESHPHYQYDRIALKLGERPYSAWSRRALELSPSGNIGSSTSVSGVRFNRLGPRSAVLEAYNRNLTSKRLPDVGLSEHKKLAAGQDPWSDA